MTKEEVFDKVTIEGNIVKLPDVQLERKLYTDVNKIIQNLGGKWDRKSAGFKFGEDPVPLIAKVQSGEKIFDKKKVFQFFETPDELADHLVELANLDGPGKYLDGYGYHNILEPSAGKGAIIKAIHRFHGSPTHVYAYELMGSNSEVLKKMEGVMLCSTPNFLDANGSMRYNRIIANPPFTKNQDIKHVNKMYELLEVGGRLVSVMSSHWTFANDKESVEFRRFMDDHSYEEVEPGTFKESGTMVKTVIVIIDKKRVSQPTLF